MIKLYVDKYLRTADVKVRLPTEEKWGEFWEKAVVETDGFSGREVAKLVVGWQAAGYSTARATLTMEEARHVLDDHIAQKGLKESWAAAQKVAVGSRPLPGPGPGTFVRDSFANNPMPATKQSSSARI